MLRAHVKQRYGMEDSGLLIAGSINGQIPRDPRQERMNLVGIRSDGMQGGRSH